MIYKDINIYRCPECRDDLEFIDPVGAIEPKTEIHNGLIRCKGCKTLYPVVGSIPRFADQDNYASTFGYQWKEFSCVQTEERQRQANETRFNCTTKWPVELNGQLVLEAACGAGRFTPIILGRGAEVYSFDLSSAVEENKINIEDPDQSLRLHLFQADVCRIPLAYGTFDKIICLGMLQHCRDPKMVIFSLSRYLKRRGELVLDCYCKNILSDMFNPKYILRPFVKWWDRRWLLAFCRLSVSVAYDIKRALIRVPAVGKALAAAIPVGALDYGPQNNFTVTEIKSIKTLSMFDMLSPKYDKPQKISTIRRWLLEADFEIEGLELGYNGINARARKK